MNSIEIKNLTKSYNEFVLDNISITLPQGMIMGLVGANGAGKSTLIKLIMNAIRADSGEITVLGVDNTSKDFRPLKQDIGIVLDEASFPEILNAKNINKIMQKTYVNWVESKYYSYLEILKIPLDKKFGDYSRGMKMKLSIAVALSHEAKLLILDEATSGLDPMIRDEVLDMLHEFTRDETHSILLSSHIVSDLEKVCDYITFIHNGQLIMSEEKDKILEKYGLLKIPEDQLDDIPANIIVAKQRISYGYELLVNCEQLNPIYTIEQTTLEDIIILMAKEG